MWKTNNKFIGIITILKLIAVILFVYIQIKLILKWKKDEYYFSYRNCIDYYKKEYKGIIIKNYVGQRGGEFSILTDDILFIWYYPIEVIKSKRYGDNVEIWSPLIEVGDSIYKPQESFNTYLYKKANPDSVVFLPYYRDCEVYIRANAETPELKIKSTYRYIETQIISKVKLHWKFNYKHEKLIKGFLIIRTNNDASIDTSALLSPQSRTYTDSIFEVPENIDNKNVSFKYQIITVIEGISMKHCTSSPVEVFYHKPKSF